MPDLTAASDDLIFPDRELDVRDVPKPERHPLIFDRFAALPVGNSFTLVNSHDPKHLRQEFERDQPGTYSWEYHERGPVWRIEVTRLESADLPRVLVNTAALLNDNVTEDAAGAVWKLEVSQRQLDANVIHLAPEAAIQTHTGPDLDVMLHVLDGGGELTTVAGTRLLGSGDLVWLPRRSQRSIHAGLDGLSYLSVHPRRPALSIEAANREPDVAGGAAVRIMDS